MLQTATYIANDPVVAQRFYEGKKAVAEEGVAGKQITSESSFTILYPVAGRR